MSASRYESMGAIDALLMESCYERGKSKNSAQLVQVGGAMNTAKRKRLTFEAASLRKSVSKDLTALKDAAMKKTPAHPGKNQPIGTCKLTVNKSQSSK